jgi:hypothetical protein
MRSLLRKLIKCGGRSKELAAVYQVDAPLLRESTRSSWSPGVWLGQVTSAQRYTRSLLSIIPRQVLQVQFQTALWKLIEPNSVLERAAGVDYRALALADLLLHVLMRPSTAPPSVVTTDDGGVQLEWHKAGIDLEIEVHPTGQPTVVFFDDEAQREFEGPLSAAVSIVLDAMARLS